MIETFKPLFTAANAYPELERLFLSAKSEIRAGFRIFDLSTRLRSSEAQAIGDTWFDLLVHTLDRSVEIHFSLSDFDPVVGKDLHAQTWSFARQFYGAAECAKAGRLVFHPVMHPAQAGVIPRLVFWPLMLRKLNSHAADLNSLPLEKRKRSLSNMPGLADFLALRSDGTATLKSLAPPKIHPATHHQKLASFDGETLFVGGLDVNERRFDSPDHAQHADETWQDISCIVTGPVVERAVAHLCGFMEGPLQPEPESAFLITQSLRGKRGPLSLSPRHSVRELEAATVSLIRSAKKLIYIETQFMRSSTIARALLSALRANPRLTLITMLPAAPETVAFENSTSSDARFGEYLQAKYVWQIQRAFGAQAFFGMPLRPIRSETDGRDSARGAPIIYIHSKLTIADDDQAILSSANLNGRSLKWDTEAGVKLTNRDQVAPFRHQAFAHWLPKSVSPELFDLDTAALQWRRLAEENAAKAPEERHGFLVPYDRKAAHRFGRPMPMVPEETV